MSKFSNRQGALPSDKVDKLYKVIYWRFQASREKALLLAAVHSVKTCSPSQEEYKIMQVFLHAVENAFTAYTFKENTDLVHFLRMSDIYMDMIWAEFGGEHPGTKEYKELETSLSRISCGIEEYY